MLLWMRATCKRLRATPIVAQATYDKFCDMLHKANISTNHVWPDRVSELPTCHSFDPFWPLFTPYFHFSNQQLTIFGDVLIDDYLSSVILDYSAHMNLVLTVNAVNQLNAIFHNHFTLRRFARQLQFQQFAIPTSLTALTTQTSMQSNGAQSAKENTMKQSADKEDDQVNTSVHGTSCHATLDFLQAHKTSLRKRDIAGTSFQITPLSSGQSPLGWKFSHFIGALHLTFGPHAVQCMLEHTYALSGTGNLPHVAAQLLIQLVKQFSASNVTQALLAAQGIPVRFIGKTRTLPGSIDKSSNSRTSRSGSTFDNNNRNNNKNEKNEKYSINELGRNSKRTLQTQAEKEHSSFSSHQCKQIDQLDDKTHQSNHSCDETQSKTKDDQSKSNITLLGEQCNRHNSDVDLPSSSSSHSQSEASQFVIISGFDQQHQLPLQHNQQDSQKQSHTLDYLTKLIEAAAATAAGHGSTLSSTQLAQIMQRYSSLPPSLLRQLACKDVDGSNTTGDSLAEGPGLINYIDTWTRRTNALVSRHLEPPLQGAMDEGWLTWTQQRQYASGPAFTHSVDFTLASSFSDEYGIRHPQDGKIVGYSRFKKDIRDPLFYDKMSDMRNGVPFDTNGEPLHTYLQQFYHPHLRLFEVSLLVGPQQGNKVIGRAIATRYTVARQAVCRAFVIAVLRDVYRVNEKKYNTPFAHINHNDSNSDSNTDSDSK